MAKRFAQETTHSASDQTGGELLLLAKRHLRPDSLLAEALPRVLEASGAGYVALVSLAASGCDTLAEAGTPAPIPAELVSDALDQETGVDRDGWIAVPLSRHGTTGEALVARGASSLADATALAAALDAALALVRDRDQQRRRIQRLEAILEIAQQWSRTQRMEPLLEQMAEAATRLLAAQRASIFLWDRPNKTLVARPALGVAGGELRIADDTGIVGQVIQTGETRRVDADDKQSRIDRRVDKQLGFQTKTLLCVPLRGEDGSQLGAFEMINKRAGNFSDEDEEALVELAAHAASALESTQQIEDLLATRDQLVDQAAEGIRLVGNSPAIGALRSTIERVADTELAVLILGENGTGKEVVGRLIHYLSRRRQEPWIAVNCAALAETLLESELFGHEKGAFTDAHEARPGKFELASGGTIFLDEIGDLSLGGQAKLLRVLEEKTVVRVGGSTPIHTDARVVAATNQNLAAMVREKRFREDLYYRLNVVTLELPALRDRGDDLLLLAEHFLGQFCRDCGRKMPRFTATARKRLIGHAWPGNVRELRNLMERLAYLLPEDRTDGIEAEDLAFILSPGSTGPTPIDADLQLTEATHCFQVEYIKTAIARAGGNMSDAAARLGLHRSNLYRKMRHLDMPVRE